MGVKVFTSSRLYLLFFIFVVGLTFIITGNAGAVGEPSTRMPDPNFVTNYQNFGDPSVGNNLYLSVGYGEHISGKTVTEIYAGNSGGVVNLVVLEATACFRAQPGGGTGTVDIRASGIPWPGNFDTTYTVINDVTNTFVTSIVAESTCSNVDRLITFNSTPGTRYRLEASVLESNVSGENLYKLVVNSPHTLGIGPRTYGGFSISNRDLPYGYNSSYGIYFATPCVGNTIGAGGLTFFDADVYPANSSGYQSVGVYPDLLVVLLSRQQGAENDGNPSNDAWVEVGRRNLAGGNGAGSQDVMPGVSFPPGREYQLQIFGLSRPNALEVLLNQGFSQENVGTPCTIPTTNWRYEHQNFTTNRSATRLAPHPRVQPGSTINLGDTIHNAGNDTGNRYNHSFERYISAAQGWQTVDTNNNLAGLTRNGTSGDDRRSTSVQTLPTNLPNDARVCYRSAVTPVSGQATPARTVDNAGPLYTSRLCVRVYNAPPTVTIDGNPSCTTLNYTINDADSSGRLRVELEVDGVIQASYRRDNQTNGSRSYDIRDWRDFTAHRFRVIVTDTNPGGQTVPSTRKDSPNNCVTASCGSFSPLNVSTGQVFTGVHGFNQSTAVGSEISRAYSVSINIAGINNATGNMSTPSGSITSGASLTNATKNNLSAATSGVYSGAVVLRITGVAAINCPVSITVADEPYVRLYGNDVIACRPSSGGGGYGGNIFTNGGFPGTSPNDKRDYVGSASQLAVFAVAAINGLPSGSQTGPNSLTTLSFANNAGGGSYGGNFNGLDLCPGNIRDELAQTSGASAGFNSLNGVDGVYYRGSNMTLNTSTIQPSQNIVLRINGDLILNGNITYNTSGWDLGNVPSVKIHVDGDIFINNTVGQLDGEYVASGDIYTCARNGGSLLATTPANLTYIADNCNSKLTVNGSMKSRRIYLLRSLGTVLRGTPRENYDSSNNPNGDNIAESFRFTPEAYLLLDGGGLERLPGSIPVYDSIITRPPSY